ETAKGFVKYIYQLTYGGTTLTGTTGVFWFITCLFVTQQLFNFISNRIHSRKAMVLISLGLYAASCLVQPFIPDYFAVPWSANAVGCAFLFYATGALYGQFLFKEQNNKTEKNLRLAAIAITIFSIELLSLGVDLSFGMKHGYYGYFVLSPLAAFGLIKLLMVSSAWLAEEKWLCTSLSFMGGASLTIMYIHRLIEYNLPKFLQGSPLFEAAVITLACCLLHSLFLQSTVSKALMLGAFNRRANAPQRTPKQPAFEAAIQPSKSNIV
ncbi:MAG: acyltransferase family protein, partial [Cyanobacteria bacterium J06598_3]